MDEITKFLIDNWATIVVIVPLLISLSSNLFGGLQKIIVEVMLFAEKKANEKFAENQIITGEQKKEFVLNYVYEKLPKFITPFITKEYLAKKLESVICDLKDIKDDGVLNASSEE